MDLPGETWCVGIDAGERIRAQGVAWAGPVGCRPHLVPAKAQQQGAVMPLLRMRRDVPASVRFITHQRSWPGQPQMQTGDACSLLGRGVVDARWMRWPRGPARCPGWRVVVRLDIEGGVMLQACTQNPSRAGGAMGPWGHGATHGQTETGN